MYVNSVGGQDELVFDGGSLIVDAKASCSIAPGSSIRSASGSTSRWARRATTRKPTVHARPRPPRPVEPPPEPAPLMSGDEQVWCALVVGTRLHPQERRDPRAAACPAGSTPAVTAAVAAEAIGPENVMGVAMPAPETPPEELELAQEVARNLGIDFHVIGLGG